MMAFNPSSTFNPLISPTSSPNKPDEATSSTNSPTATTSAVATTTTSSSPADPLRGFMPSANPLFGQFQFPQAAIAQAMAHAQAMQAAQAAAGLGFPVVYPPGIPQEFKPEMLAGANGGFPLLIDNPAAAHLYHPYGLDGMKKRNVSRDATAPLKKWLHAHSRNPYPSKGDKVLLAMEARMTLTQVSTWFANARRRLKKENKVTWLPQNRRGDDDDDDDLVERPSSSASTVSERNKESLLGKRHASSPTPSGGSSEDLTPKKPKIWSIADVAAEDDTKKESPSSDENGMAANAIEEASKAQKAIQDNLMQIARMNPQIFASMRQAAMTNPAFMFNMNPLTFFGMNQTNQPTPNGPGLMQSEESETSPNSTRDESSPTNSPSNVVSTPIPAMSPIPPRTTTPAY